MAFSPDGKRIVSSGGSTLTVWDAETGREVLTHKGWYTGISNVAFSRDGKHVVTRDVKGKVLAWDVAAGEPSLALATPPALATRRASSPDGRLLARGEGSRIVVEHTDVR